MQPHLPHKLAAWVLAASVPLGHGSSPQAAGESISINFGSNEGTIPDSSTAGLSSVTGSNWNQFGDASQSTGQALKDNNGASTGADVTWSSKNIWQTDATPTTGDGQLLKGYLDDGNGINITVSGLMIFLPTVSTFTATPTTARTFPPKPSTASPTHGTALPQ